MCSLGPFSYQLQGDAEQRSQHCWAGDIDKQKSPVEETEWFDREEDEAL